MATYSRHLVCRVARVGTSKNIPVIYTRKRSTLCAQRKNLSCKCQSTLADWFYTYVKRRECVGNKMLRATGVPIKRCSRMIIPYTCLLLSNWTHATNTYMQGAKEDFLFELCHLPNKLDGYQMVPIDGKKLNFLKLVPERDLILCWRNLETIGKVIQSAEMTFSDEYNFQPNQPHYDRDDEFISDRNQRSFYYSKIKIG